LQSGCERILHRLFGQPDVAERPREYGHRAAVLAAEDLFDLVAQP
jgi:hypothetical protein